MGMRGRSTLRESSSVHKRVPSRERLGVLDREGNQERHGA